MAAALDARIQRHWDAIWTFVALVVEALLLLWLRGDLAAWALTATITISAWALAWTAHLWQRSTLRPDWLFLAIVSQLLMLAVVVGLAVEAAPRSPSDLFWYLPLLVAGLQILVPIVVSEKV